MYNSIYNPVSCEYYAKFVNLPLSNVRVVEWNVRPLSVCCEKYTEKARQRRQQQRKDLSVINRLGLLSSSWAPTSVAEGPERPDVIK